jgi:hypothetical protein
MGLTVSQSAQDVLGAAPSRMRGNAGPLAQAVERDMQGSVRLGAHAVSAGATPGLSVL